MARRLALDGCRAYHFGEKYLVELEVMLPGDMTVRDSHDIALHLQVCRGRDSDPISSPRV